MMSRKQSVKLYYPIGREGIELTSDYKDNKSDDGPPFANLVGVEINTDSISSVLLVEARIDKRRLERLEGEAQQPEPRQVPRSNDKNFPVARVKNRRSL